MPPPPPPPPARKGGAKAMMKALSGKIASPATGAPSGSAATAGIAPKPVTASTAVPQTVVSAPKPTSPPPAAAAVAAPAAATVQSAPTQLTSSNALMATASDTAAPSPAVAAVARPVPISIKPSAPTASTAPIAKPQRAQTHRPPQFPLDESITAAILRQTPRLPDTNKPLTAGSEVKAKQYLKLVRKGITTVMMRRARTTSSAVLDLLEGNGLFAACAEDTAWRFAARDGKLRRRLCVKRTNGAEGDATDNLIGSNDDTITNASKTRNRRSDEANARRKAARMAKREGLVAV